MFNKENSRFEVIESDVELLRAGQYDVSQVISFPTILRSLEKKNVVIKGATNIHGYANASIPFSHEIALPKGVYRPEVILMANDKIDLAFGEKLEMKFSIQLFKNKIY
ncbi:MAG: hypothetical protein Roseis2KO_41680 [Roseivirga sp.]